MIRVLLLASLLLAASAPASVSAQAVGSDAEAEVVAVVERLFDGMRARDTAVIRSVFHADARLVTTGFRDGQPVVRVSPIDGFIASIGRAQQELDERIFDVEVRVQDNLASVWNGYTFHLGGEFSHCGVDAFHLVRTPDGWKIIQVADTRQREGCAAR